MTFALIIPAAGSGTRSGQPLPKQYVDLMGHPVLAHTLRAFAAVESCVEIVVAIDWQFRSHAERCADGIPHVRFVSGGAERQHSIANALGMLATDTEIVLVHDAVRPCVTREIIERVANTANKHGAAVPAWSINETVKRVDANGVVVETIPRDDLRAAQTPQGFRRSILAAAYKQAVLKGTTGTDDASLVEMYGAHVRIVPGSTENIKITVPEDFARAEAILRSR